MLVIAKIHQWLETTIQSQLSPQNTVEWIKLRNKTKPSKLGVFYWSLVDKIF